MPQRKEETSVIFVAYEDSLTHAMSGIGKSGRLCMECEAGFWTTAELISFGKEACEIETATDEMSDGEIRRVVRRIALSSPGILVEGDLLANVKAVQLMLFVTIAEFPEFYTRYGLAQPN
jgi:hypothetical protein